MDRDHIIATYHISSNEISASKFEKQALDMVNNAGVGTWSGVDLSRYGTSYKDLNRKHGARLVSLHTPTGMVRIAFPAKNFDPEYGGIPFLLNTVAGDLLGTMDSSVQLLELELPESFTRFFSGPNLGIDGLRELTAVKKRPLLAFSVKPRLGLDKKTFATLCREAFEGERRDEGVDICEDDTRLLSEESESLERIREVGKVLEDLGSQGCNKLYSVNLTGRADQVVERAKRSLEQGATALKLDVLAAGFPALQALAEYVNRELPRCEVPIFVYPAMYKIYERIDRGVLLQLSRLAGADIIYAGTPEVGTIDVIERAVMLHQYHETLKKDFWNLKSTMPSVAGGLHPGKVEFVKTAVGHDDFAYFIGGGIAGHRRGIRSGASLFAKAIKAFHVEGKTGNDPFKEDDLRAMDESGWEPVAISDEMRERADYLQRPRY